MSQQPLLLRSEGRVTLRHSGSQTPLHTILGIGRNYAEHAREQGTTVPEAPMVFSKNLASACLSGEAIVVPRACQDPKAGGDQTDYEGELAVIIGARPNGKPVKDVGESEALACVLGYCPANDVSARWWQKQGSGGQFFRGKSFDSFCPLGGEGGAVIPASDPRVADPQSLRITTRVNGEIRQDAPTSQMMFSVAKLVSELSRGMTLLPGTVILTGTPSGVGMARTPPRYLKHGDVVEVRLIDASGAQLAVLSNAVRFEGA